MTRQAQGDTTIFKNTNWENEETTQEKTPIPTSIQQTPKKNYSTLKQKIRRRQQYYQTLVGTDTVISPGILDSARQEMTHFLLQEIMPFWYGTEWDFNGYTAVPNQGEIACGYLVSTTLRDVGFRLNRYHLAQQAGYHAALSLQKKAKLRIYRNKTETGLRTEVLHRAKLKDGLYFIGLSNHVGYLLIHEEEVFFVHSNYATDKVMIEQIEDSWAFASDIYVIADITHNDTLITKWIKGETIKIVRAQK